MEKLNSVSPLDEVPVNAHAARTVAIIGTIAFHALLVVLAIVTGVTREVSERALASVSEMIDVELPEEQAAPIPEEPQKAPLPKLNVTQPTPEAAPPPETAQASEALTAIDDVVDFGNTIVTGTGSAYAGGVTDGKGTAKQAVRDLRAQGGGVVGGIGTTSGSDLSRPPRLAGGSAWDCPFPEEADSLGIDSAVVSLRITVTKDGNVSTVQVVRDPGDGFGREARHCAQKKRWAPALDGSGLAIDGVTDVNVRFER
jgi:protein TonB